MARTALMNVMVQAAVKAGRGLSRDFGEVQNLQVSVKGPGNFVSQADLRAEKTLQEELEKARPAFGFLMEEGGEKKGTDVQSRWIIDPLDGTTNFLHGIPQFAISIALERQGVIVAGLVYNPVTDEMFTAERGGGAFLNDRRLRVAARNELTDCVVACGVPHLGLGDHGNFLIQLRHVMNNCVGIRRGGACSLDLAYVAAGRFDAYWEEHLNAWDMAAGIILVREAGGFVSDINDGQDMLNSGSVLCGNEKIKQQLGAALRKPFKSAK
ncbi:Inositol-1-monophosphatase [Nymphon striatum]|nr:Inositol-1-monophosphatase [Nymphon striatum]